MTSYMFQMVTLKKRVGHCVYKIISTYFSAFVGTAIVYILLMQRLWIIKN